MSAVTDDDFADLAEFDEVDEFADLAEFDAPTTPAPDFEYTPVDLNQVEQAAAKSEPKRRGSSTRKMGAPREPMFSGHCLFPQTAHPEHSHERCANQGAGNTAVPDKVFSPCPCLCHLEEVGECTGCSEMLYLAAHYPEDPEYPGEPIYVHLDRGGKRAGSEFCS